MTTKKHKLLFVETMITQVCNLSCVGCTNYSDLQHSGYITWSDGKKQIEPWLKKLDILDFGIIGGEPLINPEWKDWLFGLRELMPSAQLRFTTNGILLKKYPNIIDDMINIGNIVFKITVHTNNINTLVDSILKKYKWESVIEHGISRWKNKNNVRFQINRPEQFIKTYQNSYRDMRPWHSQPNKAFEICCQQTCPLLYNGKIYKCSTSGLLADTLNRFGNPNFNEWVNYIPKGICVSDSDKDIVEFINNFGKPEKICGQCPSSVESLIDHSTTVTKKNKNVLT